MRLAIVAHRSTPTNLGLASALVPGVQPLLLTPAQALVRLEPGGVALGRLDVLETLDGVEPGLWALEKLEEAGVRVLNGARTLLAAHDKLVTARLLAAAGVPHPRTVAVVGGKPPAGLAPPVVVKPRFGSCGRDVARCDDHAAFVRCLEELPRRPWFGAAGAVVQELVPPLGRDVRVVVAGGSVVGAIERIAAPAEWRTNIALGGRRRRVVPSARACELAIAAAATVGGDLVGVDLLPTPDGDLTVVEANGAVEFTREYRPASDVFAAAVASLTGAALPKAHAAAAGA